MFVIPYHFETELEIGHLKAEQQRDMVQAKISGGTLFACIAHQISSDVMKTIEESFRNLLDIFKVAFNGIKYDFIMAARGELEPVPAVDERAEAEGLFKKKLADKVKTLKLEHELILASISSY